MPVCISTVASHLFSFLIDIDEMRWRCDVMLLMMCCGVLFYHNSNLINNFVKPNVLIGDDCDGQLIRYLAGTVFFKTTYEKEVYNEMLIGLAEAFR